MWRFLGDGSKENTGQAGEATICVNARACVHETRELRPRTHVLQYPWAARTQLQGSGVLYNLGSPRTLDHSPLPWLRCP